MKKEAARLWALGFGVHWLEPGSKAPVKSGWSGPVRDSLAEIERTYRNGLGLGVRLGEASRVGDGYLAVVDVDLKSSDPRHQKEAFAVVDEAFPGLRDSAPFVQTGRGFHFYVKTSKPQPSGKIKTSSEEVKIFSPSSPLNQRQLSKLTAEEAKKGLRVKSAWEVEFMSIGKQVVLPPTTHPDTKEPYRWSREIKTALSLPPLNTEVLETTSTKRERGRPVGSSPQLLGQFKPVPVDLVGSTLSDRIVNMILSGEGVEDRSAACFSAAIAMLKARFSDDEILTVLTDRETFLGETAYDHRKTNRRAAAAAWVYDYCLRKAKESVDASRAFEDEIEVTPLLASDAEVEAQFAELVDSRDWRLSLTRSGQNGEGPPKATLENLILILTHAIPPGAFRRDTFAYRDFYAFDTPWGGKAGAALTDDDALLIKAWVAEFFRFEPNVNLVSEALSLLAIKNAFHPVRERLEALPEWDLVPRIDTWLKRNFSAEGPDEYLAQVFRKWMLAAVTRVYEPGAKFDWMIIFEGMQGTGKSSFGRILFGDKHFTDWLPELSDKDAALGLQGIQCVEFGELDSLRKNELETIKAFVTRQVDKIRPPYGKRSIESPRQCVFFGTTNRDEYLKDDTGNRRFNPVKVGRLDFEVLARERDQLWAEALFIYRNGLENGLYLEGEAERFAVEIQHEKMVTDETVLMVEELLRFFDHEEAKNEVEKFDFSRFNMKDLFGGLGPLTEWKFDARNVQFAGKALKRLGGSRRSVGGQKFWKLDKTFVKRLKASKGARSET